METKKDHRWKIQLLEREIAELKQTSQWHRKPSIGRQILEKQNHIKRLRGEKPSPL